MVRLRRQLLLQLAAVQLGVQRSEARAQRRDLLRRLLHVEQQRQRLLLLLQLEQLIAQLSAVAQQVPALCTQRLHLQSRSVGRCRGSVLRFWGVACGHC